MWLLSIKSAMKWKGWLLLACLFAGCTVSTKTDPASASTRAHQSSVASSSTASSLGEAVDKLQAAIDKPTARFHISFKKSNSDGFASQCEADVSPDGIVGQQTDYSPATKVGNDVFPAGTKVRQLNGTPLGSRDWSAARGGIEMAYLNSHIGDAQEGVTYVDEEETGGYAARHFDFDLSNTDATIKRAMGVGNHLTGGRQVKDFNMKGSAWIAKENGELVRFAFDTIFLFSNGDNSTTHYEGVVTRK